jgi:hypothetical protein
MKKWMRESSGAKPTTPVILPILSRASEADTRARRDRRQRGSYWLNQAIQAVFLHIEIDLSWRPLGRPGRPLPERERSSYAKRLRFRFIAVAGTVGRSGRRLVLRLSAGYPLLADLVRVLQQIRRLARAPA